VVVAQGGKYMVTNLYENIPHFRHLHYLVASDGWMVPSDFDDFAVFPLVPVAVVDGQGLGRLPLDAVIGVVDMFGDG